MIKAIADMSEIIINRAAIIVLLKALSSPIHSVIPDIRKRLKKTDAQISAPFRSLTFKARILKECNFVSIWEVDVSRMFT
jgi:hypothetical protein